LDSRVSKILEYVTYGASDAPSSFSNPTPKARALAR